jgi:hypothetical protein
MATMRHEPWCDNLDQVKKQIVTATICPESRSDKMSQAPCDNLRTGGVSASVIV